MWGQHQTSPSLQDILAEKLPELSLIHIYFQAGDASALEELYNLLSGLVYETLGYLYVEAGDYEKALAFNTEAYEYDDEDSICLLYTSRCV